MSRGVISGLNRQFQLLRWPAGLALACVVTVVLLAGAAVLRVSVADPGAPLPGRLFTILVATAVLLGALLAVPRGPRLAWALLTIASMLAMVETVAVVRSLESVATGTAARDLAILAGLTLVAATAVAGGHAHPLGWPNRRADRVLQGLLWLGFAATGLAALAMVSVAGRPGPLAAMPGEITPLRLATRLGLATIVGALALGIGRDLGPAARRAASRLHEQPAEAGQGRLWPFLALLADELVPGRRADRERLAEAERARLAADLHAFVLPDLRRAAAAAESAGAPAAMQVDLRRALDDVEQLMHERQSIVLEQFGLVAALEWLAERTEERSPLRVQLDLDGSLPEGPGALNLTVARAAFRIALLGLDNAARHAGAQTALLRLSLDPAGLRLVIEDDGSGAASTEPGRGRGLTDMRSEAGRSGGTVRIGSGAGTRIEAHWAPSEVARNHAVRPVDSTDRPWDARR